MLPFRDINPTRNFPLMTVGLIILNALVFVYMLSLASEGALAAFINRMAVIPYEYTHQADIGEPSLQPFWLTLFSAMFMHGGPVHLLGNMLYLWIFGNNIEDIMGPWRYLLFYLLCGVIASITHIMIEPASKIPMLGASGAIAGVLGAYLVRFPSAKIDSCVWVLFFIWVVRLPAMLVLAFWFVLQLASGTSSLLTPTEGGGVAWWAHIGGFLAGMVLVFFFARRNRGSEYYSR